MFSLGNRLQIRSDVAVANARIMHEVLPSIENRPFRYGAVSFLHSGNLPTVNEMAHLSFVWRCGMLDLVNGASGESPVVRLNSFLKYDSEA